MEAFRPNSALTPIFWPHYHFKDLETKFQTPFLYNWTLAATASPITSPYSLTYTYNYSSVQFFSQESLPGDSPEAASCLQGFWIAKERMSVTSFLATAVLSSCLPLRCWTSLVKQGSASRVGYLIPIALEGADRSWEKALWLKQMRVHSQKKSVRSPLPVITSIIFYSGHILRFWSMNIHQHKCYQCH